MTTFEEAAKPIRHRIKLFQTASLIGELIKYLQQTPEMKKSGRISAPWVVLLAIDWVLELHPYSGSRVASSKDVQFILNRIWRTQRIAVNSEASPFSVQVRALLAPQIIFQKNSKSMAFFLLRMNRILDAYSKQGKKFKKSFTEQYKVEFDVFYELAFIMCTSCMTEKIKFFDFSNLVTILTPFYHLDDLATTINILSSTLSRLVGKAENQHDRRIPESEYFKESLFLDSPFLLIEKGLVVVHPTVVMIGICESLVRIFIRQDQDNRTTYTRCFEEYIDQIHREFNVSALRENVLRDFYKQSGASNRRVVDFLIQENGTDIFLDAKGVDPTNPILSATTRYDISRRIKAQHVKAIRQIIDTVDVLQTNNFDNLVGLESRFGLVVTHQDFFLGTGERILNFLPDDLKSELENLAKNKILFSHIHFMTVEQYEQINCIISETKSSLSDFFSYIKKCEEAPKTAKMIMDQYIESFSVLCYGECNVPNGSPSIIKEKDRLFEIALKAMEHNKNYWNSIGNKGDEGIFHFLKTREKLVAETFRSN